MKNAIFLDGELMGVACRGVEREMVKVASPVDGARVFPLFTSALEGVYSVPYQWAVRTGKTSSTGNRPGLEGSKWVQYNLVSHRL